MPYTHKYIQHTVVLLTHSKGRCHELTDRVCEGTIGYGCTGYENLVQCGGSRFVSANKSTMSYGYSIQRYSATRNVLPKNSKMAECEEVPTVGFKLQMN